MDWISQQALSYDSNVCRLLQELYIVDFDEVAGIPSADDETVLVIGMLNAQFIEFYKL
jgi:hypothetical protein